MYQYISILLRNKCYPPMANIFMTYLLLLILFKTSGSLNCSSNQYLNQSNSCQLCTNVLENCLACIDNVTCTTCPTNYVSNSSSQCQLCSDIMGHCLTCTSETSCTVCDDSTLGVDASVSPNVCQLCNITLQNCVNCLNTSSCQTCISDPKIYLKIVMASPALCVYCNQTYNNCVTCTPTRCTQCINSTVITLYNGMCVLCGIPLSNCMYCLTATKCNQCVNSLFALTHINNTKVCMLCAQLMAGCIICPNSTTCGICSVGVLVKNGCSPIGGCIQVVQLGIKNATCTKCNTSQFLQIPQNGICQCIKGYLTGKICTPLKGCKQASSLNTSQCKICSKMDHFQLVNGQCECNRAFYLKGDQCIQICGDGLLYYYQCDDGNLIDGDGCSSSCQIQPSYYCVFGSPYSPSRCIFNRTIAISLNSIYKTPNKNSMKITLDVSPQTNQIYRLNFTEYFNFSSSAPCNLSQIIYTGQQLVLSVDYFATIQSGSVNIYLQYDSKYIISNPVSLKFEIIQTNGEDLYYSSSITGQSALVQLLCQFISLLSLLLLLVGSFAHRMIGVQIIHTIQLVFLVQIASPNFRSTFYNFKKLILSLGQIFLTTQSTSKSNLSHYLKFYSKYSESYLTVGIAQFIGLLVIIIMWVMQQKADCSKEQKKDEPHIVPKSSKITVIKQIITNYYFYPIFLGFFFHFKLLLLNSFYNKAATDKMEISGLVLYSIINYVVFMTYFKNCLLSVYGKDSSDYGCSARYILNYLIFMIVAISLLEIQLIYPYPYFSYLFSLVLLVKMVSVIVLRPYEAGFHNFCVIVNYVILLFNTAWTELQKLRFVDNQMFPYQLALACLLGIVQLFCIIRIVLQFRQKYLNLLQKQSKAKKIDKKNEVSNEEIVFDNFNNRITASMHGKLAFQTSSNFNILNFKKREMNEMSEDKQLRQKLKAYKEIFEKQRLKKQLINTS